MKAWVVHYMNKYPDAKVIASDNSLDVHLKDGTHAVSVVKNGAGQWHDQSAEMGCRDRHDLSPIPKDARCRKVVEGKIGVRRSEGKEIEVLGEVIGHDDQSEERKKLRVQFMIDGRVLSCDELKSHGFVFCDKQKVVKAGALNSAPKADKKVAKNAEGN